jgi:hypothetical protein
MQVNPYEAPQELGTPPAAITSRKLTPLDLAIFLFGLSLCWLFIVLALYAANGSKEWYGIPAAAAGWSSLFFVCWRQRHKAAIAALAIGPLCGLLVAIIDGALRRFPLHLLLFEFLFYSAVVGGFLCLLTIGFVGVWQRTVPVPRQTPPST